MNTQKIRVTTDYSIFKILEGNRGISANRKAKVYKSIKENGWVGGAIIVNEKMEVIDGQARLAACKDLCIPIPYQIQEGATVNTCRILNQNLQNWVDSDYIASYAEEGIPSYKYLSILMKRFNMPATIVNMAATGKQLGGGANSPIRRGLFKMTTEEYETGVVILEKYLPLRPYIQKARPHTQKLSFAVLLAIRNPKVNYKRLCKTLESRYLTLEPYADLESLLEELSRIYNYNLRKDATGAKIDKVFLKEDYLRTK